MLFYAGFIKSVAVQFFNLAVAFRDRDNFQRRCFGFSEKLAFNLIDRTKAAGTDFFIFSLKFFLINQGSFYLYSLADYDILCY